MTAELNAERNLMRRYCAEWDEFPAWRSSGDWLEFARWSSKPL
jgi:hypothetical protein